MPIALASLTSTRITIFPELKRDSEGGHVRFFRALVIIRVADSIRIERVFDSRQIVPKRPARSVSFSRHLEMNDAQRNGSVLGSKTKRNMVETAGAIFQRMGLPRSTGQIYGLFYLSKEPMTLDDIVESLGISKGSASTGTRQLASIGAIRHVWVLGERRDYFESVGDVSAVAKKIYSEIIRPRLGAGRRAVSGLLNDLEEDQLQGKLDGSDAEFCRERLEGLQKLENRLQQLIPLAEKLLL